MTFGACGGQRSGLNADTTCNALNSYRRPPTSSTPPLVDAVPKAAIFIDAVASQRLISRCRGDALALGFLVKVQSDDGKKMLDS